jgi:HTH-type transcriptional regulator / antitoxin HigA
MEEMGALTIDAKRYGKLLARVTPKVIETESEHKRMLDEIEKLMDLGGQRSGEEETLLALLVSLVQDYENTHCPIKNPPPNVMLQYLMEKRGMKQAELVPIFGSSGYVSDVFHGRRGISKSHARRLAEFFRVSADLFI